MWIKNFTAASVREALAQIKTDMGANAVILDTRVDHGLTRRSGGCGARVTVTAAVERPPAEPTSAAEEPASRLANEGPRTLRLRGELAYATPSTPGGTPDSPEESAPSGDDHVGRIGELEDRMSALSETLARQRETAQPSTWWSKAEFHAWLNTQPQLRRSLADAYAGHLLDRMPDPDPFLSRDRLPATVCFVGPPGSGRSTLLMKAIALRWRTHQTRLAIVEVASASAPAGGTRLAGWAAAFDLPYHRFRFEEAGRVSRRLADAKTETVFVACDLPSADEGGERTARRITRAVGARLTVLVLSALVRRVPNEEFVQRYGVFEPTHVCFAHWDLAQPYEDVRHLAAFGNLPLGYVIAGSAPCDQIEPFTNADLRAGVAGELGEGLVRDAVSAERATP